MASHPPGECCTTGFKHEGNPAGEIKKIGGVDTYVIHPKGNQKPNKAVVILPDVFGIYTNSQLVADNFADHGFLCLIPDYFRGDALALDALSATDKPAFDFPAWLKKHQPEHIDPIVEAVITYLRKEVGVKKIGAAGYCFGGKYVARFLKEGHVDVGYTAHPSFVTHEELAAIKGPFSISAAETDTIFTTELRHESEGILIKTGQPWQINLFSGVQHGFAVRGDLSDVRVKYGKEQAFAQAVAWFKQYL